jgi:hypothetical protein
MNNTSPVRAILFKKFDAKHVTSLLTHYAAAIDKYVARDWEGVAQKAGKFVEATTKTLMIFCGKTVTTRGRDFKAGTELRQLEPTTPNTLPDVVRLVIPKACVFAYEIANNRGGRHDAHDIDANEMDAEVIIPLISWVLAEMVRFASDLADTETAAALIATLTSKKYPYFEDIDGRTYINARGLKPGEIGLLLLDDSYPRRLARQELVDQVVRHGASRSAVATAVHRLKQFVDEADEGWKLRGIGRQEADKIRGRLKSNTGN